MTQRKGLAGFLDELAAEIGSLDRAEQPTGTTWTRNDIPVAVLTADRVELRLDRAIAAAAARTPDVSASERGPEWVRFDPATLDWYAIDRLRAWFELACRRASEPAPPRANGH